MPAIFLELKVALDTPRLVSSLSWRDFIQFSDEHLIPLALEHASPLS